MKLVIFDFDGVLVDTLIMNYEISKESNEGLSMDAYRAFFNGNIYDSLGDGPKLRKHPRFFERYEEESRELKMPEPLKDVISKLKNDYNLAIVSSTPSSLITKILKQTKTDEYFSDILGNESHTSKVVKIKMLLEKYKTLPENAVYVTDTVGDILEARECDVKSIAVTWGFQEKENLALQKPFALVDTPAELGQKIEEFFK